MIKTLSKFFKKKSEGFVGMLTKYFEVKGKVQNVMFRQTFIRGAMKRELSAGATNDPENESRVLCMLQGNEKTVEDYILFLIETRVINSWGAEIEDIVNREKGLDIEGYQVTTLNVDKFNWSPNVEMFI